MQLSIIPSYICNFHCNYCYLGNLTYNNKVLSIEKIKQRVNEISSKYKIDRVVLFGGEISLLNKNYIDELYNFLNKYDLSFVTNLSQDWFINYSLCKNVHLSISLNEERPYYKETLEKIKKLRNVKNICLSVVVLPSILNKNPSELLSFYEDLGLDIIFIQYHPSIYCDVKYNITTKQFSNFLYNILKEKEKYEYSFTIHNEIILKDDTYKSTADNFLFINPNGNFSSIKYNEKEEEYYVEFNTLKEWESFCKEEKTWYYKKCNNCKYFGKCKAEHLINLNKNNCSGLYNLLEKYNKV